MVILMNGKKVRHPFLMKDDKIGPCKCDNFVLVCVHGLSSDTNISGSAGDSAEETIELPPRDRLEDLPDWFQEFTENAVGTGSTSCGDRKDPSEPPCPEPLPSNTSEGKNHLFTTPSPASRLRGLQADEHYKSSLQTHFPEPHTPRDQVG